LFGETITLIKMAPMTSAIFSVLRMRASCTDAPPTSYSCLSRKPFVNEVTHLMICLQEMTEAGRAVALMPQSPER
jgi:hypothetical protein